MTTAIGMVTAAYLIDLVGGLILLVVSYCALMARRVQYSFRYVCSVAHGFRQPLLVQCVRDSATPQRMRTHARWNVYQNSSVDEKWISLLREIIVVEHQVQT